eukprot:snap_masked-scaffold_5-processed-gene-12.30-mRNA-1 protein AED:1.00 eAED:1.00 QI:0/0/0/0/1/1/2/0/59
MNIRSILIFFIISTWKNILQENRSIYQPLDYPTFSLLKLYLVPVEEAKPGNETQVLHII